MQRGGFINAAPNTFRQPQSRPCWRGAFSGAFPYMPGNGMSLWAFCSHGKAIDLRDPAQACARICRDN